MPRTTLICEKTKWNGRAARRLANECLDVCTLTDGGSIASLRLRGPGRPDENLMWEAPWPAVDPSRYRPPKHDKIYGPAHVGKFLAGFTGHTLCLDYFGAPSEEEIVQGLCLHGEASVLPWQMVSRKLNRQEARLGVEARLPAAGLRFRREISLGGGDPVIHFSESVSNLRSADHFFHWTQHVTLGPPFLARHESTVFLSGTRALTWPHGYEGRSLLASSREFTWPHAPAEDGTLVDLSQPFLRPGTGFVASVLLDRSPSYAFLGAVNFRLGLLVGYCFPREIFPWVAIWEENSARNGSPWDGKTQARGLEFGTTPMPVGKLESFRMGTLFDVPVFCRVPARGKIRVNYVAFLAQVGKDWRGIRDVHVGKHSISIQSNAGELLELPARDVKEKMDA